MTALLYKIFLNKIDPATAKGRTSYGSFAGAVGIFCNILLCSFKLLMGFITSSISLIADGINNLSDAASSIITLIGFKLSAMPADKEHPFGHARFEYLSALVVAIMILLVGVELLKTSYFKLFTPAPISLNIFAVIVLVGSIIVKFVMMSFNIKTGRLINSQVLIATAADSRNDVITTTAVLFAMLLSNLIGFQLDGIAGVLVSIYILASGVKLLLETVNPLLGEPPSQEEVTQLKELILSGKGVLGIHDLIVHDYGPSRRFGSAHIEMCSKSDVMESHDTIDNLERLCKEQLNISMVIHYDPIETDSDELNKYKQLVSHEVQQISEQLSVHDFRAVTGPLHTNLIFDVVAPFGFTIKNSELKELIAHKIQSTNEKIFCVITIDNN